ncbi:hypothetical protein ACFQ3W_01420 [Paenibacillus puldeungensis]|uniref:Uncharacterized protein n=1 Tax=Paenibacillus puldeungensis TaxID=696536 RepID=A0ABW3RR87_9BACL
MEGVVGKCARAGPNDDRPNQYAGRGQERPSKRWSNWAKATERRWGGCKWARAAPERMTNVPGAVLEWVANVPRAALGQRDAQSLV